MVLKISIFNDFPYIDHLQAIFIDTFLTGMGAVARDRIYAGPQGKSVVLHLRHLEVISTGYGVMNGLIVS